jgi:hypothetical protein
MWIVLDCSCVLAVATMSNLMKNKLNTNLTLWPVTAGDGYGGDVFGTAVLIKGRWEDRAEKYIGQLDRRESISQAIVFVDRDIAVGDYLCRGDQTAQANPSTVPGALKVQQFKKIPDLRDLEYMRRAVL